MTRRLNELDATELTRLLADNTVTAEAVVRACIERIGAREHAVGAWAHVDAKQAIAAARAADRGPRRGVLHGIPIGVKDIFDTIDYPTECGTPIYAGRGTAWDAASVAAARAAGGIVLGKTVTAELAYLSPGKTRNPRNLEHTPGGSSSGSAAAVADCMVPLALGTQTGGSIIRPAAFCGIVGYKPSFNLVPRGGMKLAAESLDTIGFFGRSVADVALMASAITGRPALLTPRPFAVPPHLGICATQEWPSAAPETIDLFARLGGVFSRAEAKVSEIELAEVFAEIGNAQQTIMAYEIARNFAYEWHAHGGALSEPLRKLISDGLSLPPERYDAAQAHARTCRARLADIFRDVDLLVTPSAVGVAPASLATTGSPVFNRLWTLMGVPAVNVPTGRAVQGLPLGVQIVAPMHADSLALAGAAWVHGTLLL